MKQQLGIPQGASPEKRRGFARRGDLIDVALVTVENSTYTLNGSTWGFNSVRSGQPFVYVFVTGCPDGTFAKLARLIIKSIDIDDAPRRFREWRVDIDQLSNPIKNALQNVGYVQATYTQIVNFIWRKDVTIESDPDADTTGTKITLAEIQA